MSDEQQEQVGDFPPEKQDSMIVKYFKDFRILKETKKEYWGLQVINMLDCLAYFAMFNIAVVTLSNDFGFTDAGAGYIYTVFSGLTTIFLFFSGVITDWLGIKRALYIAMTGLLLCRVGVVAVQYMDEPTRMNEETQLAILHDGDGIPIVPGQPDLQITARDGTTFAVDLTGATTIGDVVAAINGASGNNGAVAARITSGWVSLSLDDLTESQGSIKVEPTQANPAAASALGLEKEVGDSNILNGDRIISDLNGMTVAQINQGRGLMGGSNLTITDRLGKSLTLTGLDECTTVRQITDRIAAAAEAQDMQLQIKVNTPGNGLRISDLTDTEEGHVIITGDAAAPLGIASSAEDEAGQMVSGENIIKNRLRSWLTVAILAGMAPFMAMIITVFQAGNRRFTTRKSRGAGFNLWYLFMNVGAAGGGFLIDIIYLRMGLPHFHVFTFGIFTGVLCLLAIAFFIRNTDQLRSPDEVAAEAEKKAEENNDSGEIKEIEPTLGESEGEAKAKPKKKGMGPWEIIVAVTSEPIFWRFTVLITLLLGVRAVFLYLGLLFPKFWYRVIGPDAQVGNLQAFNPILVIIGLILVIPILQKFNVYKMLVFGALITSISMFIPAIPPLAGIGIVKWTYITTIIFLLVLTVGELIWSPRLSEYTAAIAPEGQEGTYLGLSMVPYFAAKLVVSALSGNMLMRWCPEFPPGEPNMGQRIEAGVIGFWDSPYVMWIILGAAALFGTICAILGKGWFTKGAHFEAGEKRH